MTRARRPKPPRRRRLTTRVLNENLRLALVFAVRYAVSRGLTSAPLSVEDLLQEHGDVLSDEDLRGIIADVRVEGAVAANTCDREWDAACWGRVKTWAEKVLEERAERERAAHGLHMSRAG